MPFSTKQEQVLRFPYTDYDAIICDGAIRSGKSMVISLSFILWAMNTYKGQNFGICARTIQAGYRNLIKPILQIKYLNDNFTLRYKSTEKLLIVKRGRTENYFYLFGGADESSYELIQGITLAGVFFDEVALQPQSFVDQGLARCSVEGSKMFFSCNPESPNHWFFLEWIQKAVQKNALYIHFTLDDNPSLSKKIKQRYKSMYTGVFYQRYILGLWVRAEGIIYQAFANDPEKYIRDEYPPLADIMITRSGVDFGGTQSAHAFVATGITQNYKKLVILKAKRITEEPDPL
jgi:PBSX family phage terminase large subunit